MCTVTKYLCRSSISGNDTDFRLCMVFKEHTACAMLLTRGYKQVARRVVTKRLQYRSKIELGRCNSSGTMGMPHTWPLKHSPCRAFPESALRDVVLGNGGTDKFWLGLYCALLSTCCFLHPWNGDSYHWRCGRGVSPSSEILHEDSLVTNVIS